MKTFVWLDLNESVFVCVGQRLTWRHRLPSHTLSLLHRRHTAHASSLSLSILLAFSDIIAAGLQKLLQEYGNCLYLCMP